MQSWRSAAEVEAHAALDKLEVRRSLSCRPVQVPVFLGSVKQLVSRARTPCGGRCTRISTSPTVAVRAAGGMEAIFPEALLSLAEADPEVFGIIEDEKERQWRGIELIASENFTSAPVMEALGSCMTNKYSEGQPGARYYGGNIHIDRSELLCKQRALDAYRLKPSEWGVNVQPYSGSPANFAAYTAVLQPHDRIMGLDLPSGGHLTHGYYTANGKKISATSIYFESLPYKLNPQTGYIDYDKLEEKALDFRPKMIICGGSAYPREWDYKRLSEIATKVGAYLLCDMAHISGLVAAEEADQPFVYCDIVTTTTHKSLRGPRAGMIFFRRGAKPADKRKKGEAEDAQYDFEEPINSAVFPSLQGGPHNHQIAALAVALKYAQTPQFKQYQKQVRANSRALGERLIKHGYKLVTDGTDNHLVLWDLRKEGITGSKMEKACDMCHITLNKNAVVGDTSALAPGGVRIGAPAMSSRGLREADFEKVADFLHRVLEICKSTQSSSGKKLVDFTKGLESSEELKQVLEEVQEFGGSFAMPGFDVSALKAQHGSNGHASALQNGFGDTHGLPLKDNKLSNVKEFDPKAELSEVAN